MCGPNQIKRGKEGSCPAFQTVTLCFLIVGDAIFQTFFFFSKLNKLTAKLHTKPVTHYAALLKANSACNLLFKFKKKRRKKTMALLQ